jgi:hypothetical protein
MKIENSGKGDKFEFNLIYKDGNMFIVQARKEIHFK